MSVSHRRLTVSALTIALFSTMIGCHLPSDSEEPSLASSPAVGRGPIHGYVAARVSQAGQGIAAAAAGPSLINLPDIQVWAKSTTTSFMSPRVGTNAAGYFH